MAIATPDQLIAGWKPPIFFSKSGQGSSNALVGNSRWAQNGAGWTAGAYDNTLNGVTLSGATAGGLIYDNPGSGLGCYVGRFNCAWASTGPLVLADRLWHNGNISATSTSAQNITSPAFPARDNNGSSNGEGVALALEFEVGSGAGTPTLTVTYTNSDGTASRSATNLEPTIASLTSSTNWRFNLQAGDKGVRSVQSYTQSATWTSGTFHLVAYRQILLVPGMNMDSNQGATLTPFSGGLPRVWDNSVLYLLEHTSQGTPGWSLRGTIVFVHG